MDRGGRKKAVKTMRNGEIRVPVVPTEKMLDALYWGIQGPPRPNKLADAYSAMLAAAPMFEPRARIARVQITETQKPRGKGK